MSDDVTPAELARFGVDPDELERLAVRSDAEFADFMEELNTPLNELRRIAGKRPRSVKATLRALGGENDTNEAIARS